MTQELIQRLLSRKREDGTQYGRGFDNGINAAIAIVRQALERTPSTSHRELAERLRRAAVAGDGDDLDERLWSDCDLTARDLLLAAEGLER